MGINFDYLSLNDNLCESFSDFDVFIFVENLISGRTRQN